MEQYQIRNLYTSGKYPEIISLWNNEEERKQFSEWDYVYIMNLFYTQKNYDQCLDVYRVFHRAFPESDKLDDKMGWACYQAKIKGFDFKEDDRNRLKQQAEYIIAHSSRSEYSPKWFMVKYMLEHCKNGDFGQTVSDRDMLRYLDAVEPDTLSAECDHITLQDGRTIEQASDMENWYKERSKLLLSLGKYEQCIECCDKALKRLPSFHSNNDSWFRYRKAKALLALNNPEEARKYVKEIQARGLSHWVLTQMLYEMDINENQTDNALMHAGMCALSDPSHEMRVRFYEDYADYLESEGYAEEAALHRQLVILLRKENEWGLTEKQLSWRIPEEIAALDKQKTLLRLKKFWTGCRDKNLTWLSGTVTGMLPEGRSGFITDEQGKRYYFNSRDFENGRKHPEEGMKVRFSTMDKLDKSKGVIKTNAVNISIV